MRYGFKKRAEDLAIAQRTLLSCRSIDPLPARILSKHLQVTIVTPSEIPHFAGVHLDQLLEATAKLVRNHNRAKEQGRHHP